MVKQHFVPCRAGSGTFVRLYNGRNIQPSTRDITYKTKSTTEHVPQQEIDNDVRLPSKAQLEKVIKNKPILEKVATKLESIKVAPRIRKKPITFE